MTVNPKNYPPKIGKVIAYQGRRFDGTAVGVFTHRIINGDVNAGFVVKGDHNPNPDVQHPTGKDVLGVVLFSIPFIGKILTKKALFMIIPAAIGLWLIFDTLKDGPSGR